MRPVRKAPAIIKPPPNNTRLPANMENPRPNNNRPRIAAHASSAPAAPPPSALWVSMAPPSTPNSHKVGATGMLRPQQPPARGTPPGLLPPPSGFAANASAPQLSASRLQRNRAQSNLVVNTAIGVSPFIKVYPLLHYPQPQLFYS